MKCLLCGCSNYNDQCLDCANRKIEQLQSRIAELEGKLQEKIDIPDAYVMQMAVLKNRIAELEETLMWIPVTERLPEKEKSVLARYSFQPAFIAKLVQPGWEWIDEKGSSRGPTHWMEIPKL